VRRLTLRTRINDPTAIPAKAGIQFVHLIVFTKQSDQPMAKKKFPLHPKHPERICWGCDKYCPADSLLCGNGSGRTEHPAEMLGEDWYTWGDWAEDFATDAEKIPDPSG